MINNNLLSALFEKCEISTQFPSFFIFIEQTETFSPLGMTNLATYMEQNGTAFSFNGHFILSRNELMLTTCINDKHAIRIIFELIEK
jgi:hypothetical protein